MDLRCRWIFLFGVVALLINPQKSTFAQNHVDSDAPIGTQLPMVEPGQPQREDARKPSTTTRPVTTRALTPTTTPYTNNSATTTPPLTPPKTGRGTPALPSSSLSPSTLPPTPQKVATMTSIVVTQATTRSLTSQGVTPSTTQYSNFSGTTRPPPKTGRVTPVHPSSSAFPTTPPPREATMTSTITASATATPFSNNSATTKAKPITGGATPTNSLPSAPHSTPTPGVVTTKSPGTTGSPAPVTTKGIGSTPVDLYSATPTWNGYTGKWQTTYGTLPPTMENPTTTYNTRYRTSHAWTTYYRHPTTPWYRGTTAEAPATTRVFTHPPSWTTEVPTPPATTPRQPHLTTPLMTTPGVPTVTRAPTTTPTPTRRWTTWFWTTTKKLTTVAPTTTPWFWPFPTTTPTAAATTPTATTTLLTTSHPRTTRPSTTYPASTTRRSHTPFSKIPVVTGPPPVANASYKLPAYVQLRISTTWYKFCPESLDFQETLADYVRKILKEPSYSRITTPFLNVQDYCRGAKVRRLRKRSAVTPVIPLDFFVAQNGSYFENSTRKIGAELAVDYSVLQNSIPFQIVSTHLLLVEKYTTSAPKTTEGNQGVVIGTTLTVCALVFGVILSLVGIKIHKVRKSQAMTDRYYFDGKQLQDALSESHQMRGVSPTEGSTGGLPSPTYREYFLATINKGLVLEEEEVEMEEEAEEALPSHTLNDNALTKFYSYREAITEEFENLPNQRTPGSETKKKLPHQLMLRAHGMALQSPEKTRVPVPPPSPTLPLSPGGTGGSPDIIIANKSPEFVLDASFIRGYDQKHCSYIAARVSGAESSDAFWRMVWEQQSRTVVCLCSPYELGKVCPQYWPTKEGGPGAQLYGSILVTLKGGASGEHYFTSSLLVRNIQKTLCRPVTHYWFSNWQEGEGDVPNSPQALMSMLLQVHNTHQESYGPVIVHCSDGIGRTGLVIATDINMQRLEETHSIDIPRTVSTIRQDRGHAVANVDQYAFVYKTLYEFSKFLSTAGAKETSDTESVAHDNTDSMSDTANEDLSSLESTGRRPSSYLGDLSATVKRRLALKFPSLSIGGPSQAYPTKTRVTSGDFVVLNSPNSTNLDMSVVSALSESEKGKRLSMTLSRQSSTLDQSFCIQNDGFLESGGGGRGNGLRLFPQGSRHFTVGQRPARRETTEFMTSRPLSAYTTGTVTDRGDGYSGYDKWNPHFTGQSARARPRGSPRLAARHHEDIPNTMDDSHTSKSEQLSESLGSMNPFSIDEFQSQSQPQRNNREAPVAVHTRQPSYPVDMNPFGLTPSEAQSASSRPAQPAHSSYSPCIQESHSNSSQVKTTPGEPDADSSSNTTYPTENNPFDTPSEFGGEDFAHSSGSSSSSLGSSCVLVTHSDTAGLLVRQGTYPKGMNPFEEGGSLGGRPLTPRGLRLLPKAFKQNKTPAPARKEASQGQNPFGEDWMDSAEESFT